MMKSLYELKHRKRIWFLSVMVEVDRHAPAEVVKSVIGLKADADAPPPAVSEAEAAAFAAKHGALCGRCSARDDTHVTELFSAVAEKLVRNGFDRKVLHAPILPVATLPPSVCVPPSLPASLPFRSPSQPSLYACP